MFCDLTPFSPGLKEQMKCQGWERWSISTEPPTFNLVDIWYPRGFSVSPPGQMIFLSFGMTWGWEYEMEGGHAGVLAPGP